MSHESASFSLTAPQRQPMLTQSHSSFEWLSPGSDQPHGHRHRRGPARRKRRGAVRVQLRAAVRRREVSGDRFPGFARGFAELKSKWV